jgi:hypothetical protein
MTDFPSLDKIPLISYVNSKPQFSLVKSGSVKTRRKRLLFLEYAAKNKIDDTFKEEYLLKTHKKNLEKHTFPSRNLEGIFGRY